MKDRNKKFKIMEIMNLAFLVHQETEYCVFIDWSGHVDQLSISIRESVANYQTKVCELEFYTYWKLNQKNIPYDDLKAKKLVLESILDTHDIPYDMCERITETSYRYAF